MKRKILLILGLISVNVLTFAQYSGGGLVGITGISVQIETTPTMVRLTLSGPSNSFLGLGAGSNGMEGGADGFIYSNAASRDYTFNGVGVTPSADAIQDWTVISNNVSGSTRTVVATRSLSGSAGDTPIPNAAGTIDVFVAKGNGTLTLSQHGAGIANRDYATIGMNFDSALATGEVDLNMEKKILLYPNPSKGIVYLNNAEKIKTIALFDTSGRKVLEPKINNNQIDISQLNSGKYFIEIENSDGTKVFEKILKQ
jgi:hypothetical protein